MKKALFKPLTALAICAGLLCQMLQIPVLAQEAETDSSIPGIAYNADSVEQNDDDEVAMLPEYKAQAIQTEFSDAEFFATEEIEKGEYAQIHITTAAGIGNSLTKADGYTTDDTRIQIIPAASDTDSKIVDDSNCVIKVRGNSTAGYSKKPYTFKLSKKTELLGMSKQKTWVLLANYFDATYLRNYMAFDFAQHLGLQYTPQQRFVELYMDGVYRGCYTLMEKIDKVCDMDIDAGEFLLEYDRRTEDGITYVSTEGEGFYQYYGQPAKFAISIPEEPNQQQYDYIQNCLDNFYYALQSGDWQAVEDICDVDSFVKFYLLNEYWKTLDIRVSSVYFYYQDGKFHAGPPWDFDLSTGNASWENGEYDNYNNITWTSSSQPDSSTGLWAALNIWYPDLLHYTEFREKIYTLFDQEKEHMQNMYLPGGQIDTLLDQYKPLIDKNFLPYSQGGAGWDVTQRSEYISLIYHPKETVITYDTHLDFFRSWLQRRFEWMNENLRGELEYNYARNPEQAPADTSGKWGTAAWTLSANGTLTISSGTADGKQPQWDASKVKKIVSTQPLVVSRKDLSSLFKDYPVLESADLSGWNTEKVTYYTMMFDGCTALKEVNLAGWKLNGVSLYKMFHDCSSLQTLNLSGSIASSALDLRETFAGCSSLLSLDLSGWVSGSLTDLTSCFDGCSSLQTLDVQSLDLTRTFVTTDILKDCGALEAISLSDGSSLLANSLSGNWTHEGGQAMDASQIVESWTKESAGWWTKETAVIEPVLADDELLIQMLAAGHAVLESDPSVLYQNKETLASLKTLCENHQALVGAQQELQKEIDEAVGSIHSLYLSLRLIPQASSLSALN